MRFLAKYKKAFSLGLQSSLEYRFNFLLGFLSFIFTLTIQYFMWSGIFQSSESEYVYGYTYSQMIIYSFFAALVSKLVAGGFEYGILDDIKNGGLSKFVIKPVGYLPYRLSCYLGEKSFYSVIIFVFIAILSLIFRLVFDFRALPSEYGLFAVSIALSLLLNFFIYSTLSALAFWITEAAGLFVIAGLVINALSGGIFPLDIFGSSLQQVFRYLPFQYTIYFSVNILGGKLGMSNVLFGLGIQCLWIGIMALVMNLVWKAGLKKYVAVGG